MEIRRILYQIYWYFQKLITPKLRYSQYLYEDILNSYNGPEIKWLDLGCGHQILPPWRQEQEKRLVNKCKQIVGMDYDLPSLKNHESISLKVNGDISRLPFNDRFFDLVTANMVVEHLDNPATQFSEVCRVLKPGGIFIFHTPSIFGYTTILARLVPHKFKDKLIYVLQGRKEDDVFPTYYRANRYKGINTLAGNV